MIPPYITRDHVLAAMARIDKEGVPAGRQGAKFEVRQQGCTASHKRPSGAALHFDYAWRPVPVHAAPARPRRGQFLAAGWRT